MKALAAILFIRAALVVAEPLPPNHAPDDKASSSRKTMIIASPYFAPQSYPNPSPATSTSQATQAPGYSSPMSVFSNNYVFPSIANSNLTNAIGITPYTPAADLVSSFNYDTLNSATNPATMPTFEKNGRTVTSLPAETYQKLQVNANQKMLLPTEKIGNFLFDNAFSGINSMLGSSANAVNGVINTFSTVGKGFLNVKKQLDIGADTSAAENYALNTDQIAKTQLVNLGYQKQQQDLVDKLAKSGIPNVNPDSGNQSFYPPSNASKYVIV